jgi:hypothetical protein
MIVIIITIIRLVPRRPDKFHTHFHTRDANAWVAQWNYIGRLLGGHDAGDAGHAENVAFVGALALAEEGPGAGVGEGYCAGGGGDAFCFGFRGDLCHVHCLGWSEVWEVGVRCGWESVGFASFL